MGNAINQDVRALWLMLQQDGGWWSVSMLTHFWRPTFDRLEVQQAMDALEAGEFIVSRQQLRETQYAFTSECHSLPDATPVRQPGAMA